MPKLLLAFAVFLLTTPVTALAAPINIVTSFTIIEDMVKQIAGDSANVHVIVRPNSDAHDYQPTPSDIKMLGDADLLIVNGLGFESWLGKIVVAAGYTGQIVRASEGINALTMPGGRDTDPHAWHSLANGRVYAINIREALIKADAANADNYRRNAENYLKQIEQTESWAKTEMAKIPMPNRRVISTHDAFQYFSSAYGISFVPALGASSEATLSAADMAKLIDQIKSQNIKVLFMENIADPAMIQQLETDTGARIGGTLFSDALTVSGGPADSYLAMFRANVTTLVQALANH